MVRYSAARAAALLDSAGPGTSRPASSSKRPATMSQRVEAPVRDVLVVRVPLCQGPIELRVPRAEAK